MSDKVSAIYTIELSKAEMLVYLEKQEEIIQQLESDSENRKSIIKQLLALLDKNNIAFFGRVFAEAAME